eukprot:Nitzschia sp. Nitz4//scaffold397_size11424//10631//11035//NITZ4_009045-RA/size11424-processed-gene-0.7-mRNA-1//-1//CDS//3329550296//4940//frame0
MSRRVADNRQERNNRDNLFQQRRANTSSTASEAQSIQKSLMRTQDLLKNELQRVSHLGSAIEEDGHVLLQAMDQHKSINTRNAQKALTALQRAQRHEQRVLMSSVFFFLLVAFYILWARVLITVDIVSMLWSWM